MVRSDCYSCNREHHKLATKVEIVGAVNGQVETFDASQESITAYLEWVEQFMAAKTHELTHSKALTVAKSLEMAEQNDKALWGSYTAIHQVSLDRGQCRGQGQGQGQGLSYSSGRKECYPLWQW